MQNNLGRKFFTLYQKEMRELLPEILVVAGLALLVLVLALTVAEPFNRIMLLPLMMLIGLAGLLPVVSSFKLVSREWTSNSIYLLLSLPVGGTSVLGAKLAALITQYLVGALITAATFILLSATAFPEIQELLRVLNHLNNSMDPSLQSQLVWGRLLILLATVSTLAFVISISFFSQIAGRLVRRGQGLITGGIFVVFMWLTLKVIFGFFQFLYGAGILTAYSSPLAKNGCFLAVTAFLAVIIFTVTAVIYDRKVEL